LSPTRICREISAWPRDPSGLGLNAITSVKTLAAMRWPRRDMPSAPSWNTTLRSQNSSEKPRNSRKSLLDVMRGMAHNLLRYWPSATRRASTNSGFIWSWKSFMPRGGSVGNDASSVLPL
jgi:hypothetical protein